MSLGFFLKGIRTEQFAIFPEHLDSQQQAQVRHSIEFKLNAPFQQVGVYANFEFMQQHGVVMKIVVSCHFGIEPKTWDSFLRGTTLSLPLDFSINLAMITVGATRGILASKTEHSPLSKYILPLLDITNIIKTDISFNLG